MKRYIRASMINEEIHDGGIIRFDDSLEYSELCRKKEIQQAVENFFDQCVIRLNLCGLSGEYRSYVQLFGSSDESDKIAKADFERKFGYEPIRRVLIQCQIYPNIFYVGTSVVGDLIPKTTDATIVFVAYLGRDGDFLDYSQDIYRGKNSREVQLSELTQDIQDILDGKYGKYYDSRAAAQKAIDALQPAEDEISVNFRVNKNRIHGDNFLVPLNDIIEDIKGFLEMSLANRGITSVTIANIVEDASNVTFTDDEVYPFGDGDRVVYHVFLTHKRNKVEFGLDYEAQSGRDWVCLPVEVYDNSDDALFIAEELV